MIIMILIPYCRHDKFDVMGAVCRQQWVWMEFICVCDDFWKGCDN